MAIYRGKPGWGERWTASLLAASFAVCGYWFVAAWGYWEDDAYIHLEFARSLAAGQGFSFNGRVVYGDTAPLWAGLLAGAHWLAGWVGAGDWLVSGKALTVVAAGFGLSGVWALARVMVGASMSVDRARLFAATMVLVVVTGPYFGYWAFSGMEALAAAGLVCWGMWVISGEGALTAGRFLAGAAIVGVAPLLRPELALLSVLLGGVLVWQWSLAGLRLKAQIPCGNDKPERLAATMVGGVVLALGPGLAWSRYALVHFGSVLPTTNAAKRAGPGESVVHRLLQVYGFGYPTLLLGVVLGVGWLAWRARTRRRFEVRSVLPPGGWVVLVWVAITTAFYVANHTLVQTRYVFVAAPALLVVAGAIAARGRRLYRVGLVLTLGYGVVVSVLSTRPLVRNKVEIDREYAALAAYVRGLPPGVAVAEYSIGEAAFLSGHTVVDTGGITRPGVIAYLYDPDETRLQAWVLGQGATHEVIDHQPLPGAVAVWSAQVPATGWSLDWRRYRARERLVLWRLR